MNDSDTHDAGEDEGRRAPDYERLHTLLRDDILSGRIPAGARLKVSDIAATYDTSTNPAREALRGLEGEGLVTIQPNRGARVRVIDERLVSNLFDIRGMIEPHIVRFFVENASPADIETLEVLERGCEQGAEAGDHGLFHSHNIRFHDLILDRYPNEEAIKTMRQHSTWLRALSRKHPLTAPQMRRSSAEHVAFIEAVHRGDAEQAITVMQRHRQNSRRVFLANMREDAAAVATAASGLLAPRGSGEGAARPVLAMKDRT
jgi:DNA-binding GntR family transcriptional regulator